MVAPKTYPRWDLDALKVDWESIHRKREERRRGANPLTQFTRFCPYCGTRYELPPFKEPRIEHTLDICPPAEVAIYAVEHGSRLPDLNNDPIVHNCRKGVPRDLIPCPSTMKGPFINSDATEVRCGQLVGHAGNHTNHLEWADG